MGIDVGIALFDFSKFTRDEATSHLDLIKKDLKDEESTEYGGLIRNIESTSEYAKKVYDFDEDGRNIFNIYDLYLFLNYYPLHENNRFNSFSLGKSGTLMEVKIPEFLAHHSEETAILWNKLVGRWEQDNSNETKNKNSYDLKIGEKEYLISNCEQGGYLQGDEIKSLRKGLESIMPKVDEFYNSLDRDKVSNFAKRTRPIELIYGLTSNEYIIFDSSTLIYYRDT
jgi:hypothetical protein